MSNTLLHYYHDPLCGWCYAAEPLVQAAVAAKVPVVLHGGGLWNPPGRVPETKRAQIRVTDRRIHDMTGQTFGAAYLDGLLDDPATIYHSRPTIAAILAAEKMEADAGMPMLTALQRAHYVDGRRIVDTPVLVGLARAIGLDAASFVDALGAVAVDIHIQGARAAMHRYGLHGFPSFLLECDGDFRRLAHEGCYGNPQAFLALIASASSARQVRAQA